MNFTGKAKRLDDIDLPMIGGDLGLGEDEIHAVIDAETSGSGFDRQNRPKMLFEPHVFYRLLGPGLKRDRAIDAGLAYRKWGQKKYPADSYPRLIEAIAIDKDLALQSASWGLGQIMGFNAQLAGYDDAEAMVRKFLDDEEHHLRAMMVFIANAGLRDKLAKHDWRGFARGYNGPGFEKNGYHTRLAASYRKWAAIPDTPLPATPEKIAAGAAVGAGGTLAGAGYTWPAVAVFCAAVVAFIIWKRMKR